MSTSATVRAQAKVNLTLRVLARETTGYHSIETVFLRLDLADDLRIHIAPGRSLDCAGPALPNKGLGPVEKNLAYRAAAAYADQTGWPAGFAIELVKHIPTGAGLGGGSADAGAVLRALDALAPNPLGTRLIELAAAIGADVPFMTIESPLSLAWGRGERLYPLAPLPPRPVIIVMPDFSVSTGEAYQWVADERGSYAPRVHVLSPSTLTGWGGIAEIATNDFERVVAGRHPEIAELVDDLRAGGALISMMSGSGSAVFGVFASPPDRAAITRSTGRETIATNTSDRVVRVELGQ